MTRHYFHSWENAEKFKKVIPLRKLIHILVSLSVIAGIYIYIQPAHGSEDASPEFPKNNKLQQKNEDSEIFKAFHDCIQPKLKPIKDNLHKFWFEFANVTRDCDNLEEYSSLDIQKAQNNDEIKYVVFPMNKDEQLTMVTLGIGHDIQAELKLKEMYPNVDFYGADPGIVVNKDLYENKLGGKYYHYAVSGETGMQRSKVYTERGYTLDATEHIRADYFFANILNKNRIDILWMDIEQNEYGILDQIHQNGKLDENGVKICQMNVEFHKDVFGNSRVEMQKFHDFVYKVLEDKKYIIIKPSFAKYKTIGFVRVFIINVADEDCTDLFIK